MRLLTCSIAVPVAALAVTGAAAAVGTHKPSARIAAEVPAPIRTKALITVATAATYPPNEFLSMRGRHIMGMDPDLVRTLGSVLGLRARIVNVRFGTIIPGLVARKFDVGMSSITDTRQRERVVDFVTYFSAGTSFYVKANAGPHITSLAALCGRTVAVVRGTTEETDARVQNLNCRRAGRPDVQIAAFPDYNGAFIALESSNTAVGMADSHVASYIVKRSGGQLELTGSYGVAFYGIALPKRSRMAQPVIEALRTLIADGTYREILKTWGVESGAVAKPQINGAAR